MSGDGDLVPVTIKIELMCCRHIYDDGKRHGYCYGDLDDSYDDAALVDTMTGVVTDTVTTWISQES